LLEAADRFNNIFRPFPAYNSSGGVIPVPVRTAILFTICFFFLLASPSLGASPRPTAEDLLPDYTVAMLSLNDRGATERKWESTQLGYLVESPQLQPFVEQVRDKIQGELQNLVGHIGADWGTALELGDRATAIAMVQPDGPKSVAFVLLVEITVSNAQRNAVINRLRDRLKSTGAVHTVEQMGSALVHVYQRDRNAPTGSQVFHAVSGRWFLAASHRSTAQSILQRMDRADGNSLADTAAHKAIVSRTQMDDKEASLQWFLHPIRYAQAVRTLTANGQRGGSMLRALANQGFDVLGGVGGVVYLAEGQRDVTHHTFIYLNGPLQKTAKILDFPNGEPLHPRSWALPHTANYISFRWRMTEAFESIKPLVNEMAEDDVFEQMLTDIKEDTRGPQLDIRRDLIAHLGQRITIVTACDHPVNPRSHQLFAAFDLTDSDAVASALNKALGRDPSSKQLVIAGHRVWELGQDEEDSLTLEVEIEGGLGFGLNGVNQPEPESESEDFPKLILGVVGDKLIVASEAAFAESIFTQQANPQRLGEAADYQRVHKTLQELGCGPESLRVFSRTDETCHAIYEMLRRGESLDTSSLLGRLVSKVIEQSDLETAAIDGSQLPPFDELRPFLGPAGASMVTVADGWLIRGCLLRKVSHAAE
jgi:hypothetical protein